MATMVSGVIVDAKWLRGAKRDVTGVQIADELMDVPA
jgi:hypothetical protein